MLAGRTEAINGDHVPSARVIGGVRLHYTGETHLMREGDSALLDGGAPHKWENATRRRARVLWVILG